MKKKFISLLLAGTLVLSNSALVFAEENVDAAANTTTVESTDTTKTENVTTTDETTTEEETTTEDAIAPVADTEDVTMVRKSISEAYSAMKDGSGVIIDLRNDAAWAESHIDGSEHIAIFDAEKNPAGLAEEFAQTMAAKKTEFSGKKIYLLCYSGNRGAQNATNILSETEGYDISKVFTITDGANAALAEGYMGYNYIDASAALAEYYNNTATIVDLRATADFATGHLSGAKNYPVFESKGVLFTDESKFTEFTKNVTALTTKNVYVLCYAGKVGAKKAVDLTRGIGKNVRIITGGSTDPIFAAANVANAVNGITEGRNEITYDALKDVIKNASTRPTVLDLRPYAEYREGHFEKSISAPIFALTDHQLFTTMQANAKNYSGDVYVLCYTGNKGAEKATIALKSGNPSLNVITVAGGNKAITASDPKAMNFVPGEKALSDEKGVIIDVRSAEEYAKGHIKGSISLPVVTDAKAKTPELEKAFKDYMNAHPELADKNIYLLCYTGSSCAAAATTYLSDIKWNGNVMTIDWGAKDATIAANLIKEGTTTDANKPANTNKPADNKSKSPKTGDAATTLPLVAAMGAAVLAIVNRKKFAK